jgi:hypothetical protein
LDFVASYLTTEKTRENRTSEEVDRKKANSEFIAWLKDCSQLDQEAVSCFFARFVNLIPLCRSPSRTKFAI